MNDATEAPAVCPRCRSATCPCYLGTDAETDRIAELERANEAGLDLLQAVKEWGKVPTSDTEGALQARLEIWETVRRFRVAIGDD